VDDDGPGVERDDRERIFEWQYYMTTAPSQRRGCCAELVIARRIARSSGGELVVGASPMGGSRFTLRLPLQPAQAGEAALDAGLAAAS
jgi:signal transduction histidine kinase